MRAPGKKIRCMEKVSLFGLMEGFMMENITWIKKKGLGSLCGQMEEDIKANGKMESRMAKENIQERINSKRKGYGFKGKEVNGQIEKLELEFFRIFNFK